MIITSNTNEQIKNLIHLRAKPEKLQEHLL
jgi:hypothetical protein